MLATFQHSNGEIMFYMPMRIKKKAIFNFNFPPPDSRKHTRTSDCSKERIKLHYFFLPPLKVTREGMFCVRPASLLLPPPGEQWIASVCRAVSEWRI